MFSIFMARTKSFLNIDVPGSSFQEHRNNSPDFIGISAFQCGVGILNCDWSEGAAHCLSLSDLVWCFVFE